MKTLTYIFLALLAITFAIFTAYFFGVFQNNKLPTIEKTNLAPEYQFDDSQINAS